MPNPRANRPLTLDQVTADLKSLSQPAFYPRVGNIQARGMRSPQPQPMREQTGPKMPQWGDYDLSVPTQANRAMSQRMVEQDALERAKANADMSPLEKAGAAMQAARLAGSGLTQLALSMPMRIRSGDQAADDYIAENLYKPTIPKATEYVSDLGEMLEQLETRYKLPPIMPELLAFQEMAGPAARQVAKTGARAGRAAGSSAAQMFDQSMRMAPEGQAIDQGFAGGGLLKGIKAARKGALNAERSMPARGALSFADEPMAGPSVIKEKGGNWLSGGVERALKPLKVGPQDVEANFHQVRDETSPTGWRSVPNPPDPINQWIERNLTNYIKKEMATPEDPVRRLAEQGITHMPANEIDFANAFLPEKLALKRMNAGFPTQDLGESPTAQGWERITDELMNVAPASEHTRPLTQAEIRQGVKSTTEADPWLNKVDPNTPIYYPENMDSLARDLGFDHIVDVLREDIATGRIRPEQLSKVSMEQAVRRTYEYDQELAKKMAEARTSAREGLPVHKEYPEGYRWIELNRPGAFAQESEAMGHSVRGYEPPRGHPDWAEGSGESGSSGYGHGGWEAIKSGKAKVYSLIDSKGEPHVTVEVGASKTLTPEKRAAQMESLMNRLRGEGMSEEQAMSQAIKLYPESETLSRITQIKGKQNAAPKEEYLPFVQDFVKGGKWSDVGDLQNTQLTHIEDVPEVKQYRAAGMELPSYVTDKERDDLIYEYLKKTRPASDPDFMQSEYGFPPPEDGMKHGGSVHISDNPDTMMMELGDRHFQVGGIVDAAARTAKAAKAAQMKKAMKASEALAQIEGKNLNITQADRTKVGEGLLGGPGFSGLQLQEGPHKQAGAVWGVKNPGTAKTMLGGFKDPLGKEYFTTMIGSPTQHQSNQMVFDKLYGKFKSEAKKGNLDPELQQKINERLANAVDKDGNPVFPPDVDILSKDFKKIANTFDRRSIAGNLIGGVGVGGRKGQIIDYDKIIRDTTDPFLLDMPSGSLGHRLWTPSGEIIDRPDLHPAFPAIATGEDLGVEFTPAAQDILMAPWIENVRQTKGRNPGYMDWTRGRPPSVQVSDEILRKLEESGNKEGGAITAKRDGQKFKPGKKPDQILKHGQAMPRGKDPEVDIGQMAPMMMAGGGEVNADDLILEERPL